LHLSMDVLASDPRDGIYQKTTHCIIIFVAVNAEGERVEVPRWLPETPEDQAMEHYAIKLMNLREQIDTEMSPYRNLV
ncbi:MAG: acyl-CoA thioesterase, partial [Candidatus Sericytochromatia bacterium]